MTDGLEESDVVACMVCSQMACGECWKRRLEEIEGCPHCNQIPTLNWVKANFTKAFLTDTYLPKYKARLVEREKANIPVFLKYADELQSINTQLTATDNLLRQKRTELRTLQRRQKELKVSLVTLPPLKTTGNEEQSSTSENPHPVSDSDSDSESDAEMPIGGDAFVPKDKTWAQWIPCPKQGCLGFVRSNGEEADVFSCCLCHTVVCKSCWVAKIPDKEHTCSESDLTSVHEIMSTSRRCPICTVPIYRDGGCTNMICRVCNKRFSWSTLQPWANEKAPRASSVPQFGIIMKAWESCQMPGTPQIITAYQLLSSHGTLVGLTKVLKPTKKPNNQNVPRWRRRRRFARGMTSKEKPFTTLQQSLSKFRAKFIAGDIDEGVYGDKLLTYEAKQTADSVYPQIRRKLLSDLIVLLDKAVQDIGPHLQEDHVEPPVPKRRKTKLDVGRTASVQEVVRALAGHQPRLNKGKNRAIPEEVSNGLKSLDTAYRSLLGELATRYEKVEPRLHTVFDILSKSKTIDLGDDNNEDDHYPGF